MIKDSKDKATLVQMTDQAFLLNYETALRLGFFVGVFLCLGVCEGLAPRRALSVSKRVRWLNNLGIVLIDSLAVRWLLPVAAWARPL